MEWYDSAEGEFVDSYQKRSLAPHNMVVGKLDLDVTITSERDLMDEMQWVG